MFALCLSLGLDSRAALNVVGAVKRLAASGRTVICTIHQPSLALVNHFDDLLLLKRGELEFAAPYLRLVCIADRVLYHLPQGDRRSTLVSWGIIAASLLAIWRPSQVLRS